MCSPLVVNRFTLDDPDWDVLDAELPMDVDELERELQGDISWQQQIATTS